MWSFFKFLMSFKFNKNGKSWFGDLTSNLIVNPIDAFRQECNKFRIQFWICYFGASLPRTIFKKLWYVFSHQSYHFAKHKIVWLNTCNVSAPFNSRNIKHRSVNWVFFFGKTGKKLWKKFVSQPSKDRTLLT